MLLHLKIANLATLREIILDLSPGLTCVTGETGSGKSLFVDALSFLSGQKNRLLFVPEGRQEGVVEAIFSPFRTEAASSPGIHFGAICRIPERKTFHRVNRGILHGCEDSGAGTLPPAPPNP